MLFTNLLYIVGVRELLSSDSTRLQCDTDVAVLWDSSTR